MNYFITDFVNYVLKNDTNFKNICIVVPNNRTGLFIKKNFSEQINKPALAPEIKAIKEIFVSNSELVEADEVYLLFHLYATFQKYMKTSLEFDEFYYRGEIILKDFDFIDKYLVDSEKLFSNLKEIKEIDSLFDKYDETELEIIKKFWQNINQAKLSEHKKSFLTLWGNMNNIYNEFRSFLIKQGVGYEGLIYRQFTDKLANNIFEKEMYYFVGFNALNRCEYELFRFLNKQQKAKFFWDADKYYTEDKIQEAGYFIRTNIRDFPNAEGFDIYDNISAKKTDIEVIATPSEIAQTKLVPDILNEWSKEKDFNPEKTAIILGDEKLLIPLMYSIPENFQTYNISMGYPIKNTSAYSFITHLCNLQRNTVTKNNKKYFYYKNVINLLKHSYLSDLYKSDCKKTENHIINNNLILIEEETLHENDLFKTIFSFQNSNAAKFSTYLTNLTSEILHLILSKEELKLEVEFLRKINLRLNVICDRILTQEIEINNINILCRLIINSFNNLTVPFEGEPLQGVQILGFMETRALDFDRILMLSINEGHIPKKSTPQSIIPYNLKKFYGLPSIEYQDSIYAYYFYRLLQRAKNVKIIYSAYAQDGQGEASRFISQLNYEFKNINISRTAYKIKTDALKIIKVKKSKEIISNIKKYLQNGISPSAINSYLNCSLMYYFKYIEKITEPAQLEEKDDAAYFGQIFHESMKFLYGNLPEGVLSEKDIDKLNNDTEINKAIEKAVITVLKIKNENLKLSHTNTLLTDVVRKYIKLMLEFDKNQLPFSIIGLESKKNFNMELNVTGEIINCNIEGIIDRIDFIGGIYRVLDYKTGKVKTSAKSIEELFAEDRKDELNGITQTLLYSLMLDNNDNSVVCPGLLNINELFTGSDYQIKINKSEITSKNIDIINEFIKLLKSKLEELADINTEFRQTNNSDNCKYCDYKTICMK